MIDDIVNWIQKYAVDANLKTLVIGISGGIDSAVVSTLCARTGLTTIAVSMPIHQRSELHDLSMRHGEWLTSKFPNVKHVNVDLTKTFDTFIDATTDYKNDLASANSRARLRMTCLYQIAQSNRGLVVGTGNKIEDFGVGFFTKYGDGGVDISPIGDLYKTEVWHIGRELGVLEDIINAEPTDGLWDDGRTDEMQMNIDYVSLEKAMRIDEVALTPITDNPALNQYRKLRAANLHKMLPIPVFRRKGT